MSELFDPPHDKENLPDIYFVNPFVHSVSVGAVALTLSAFFTFAVDSLTTDTASPAQTRHEVVASAVGQPAASPP